MSIIFASPKGGSGGGVGTDESVKVSPNDTTAGFLNGKLVAGANITLTENNDGGNETLTIAATSGGSGDMAKSVYDTDNDGIVEQADVITGQGALATLDTVGTTEIDNGAVTNSKIANGAIGYSNLSGSVKNSLDLADTAVQPGDLATVATSGDYNDLANKPDLSAYDDVLEYVNLAGFPVTGETGKIYVAQDTQYIYRWSGSTYVQLTDQTAIWGQISGTLADQTDLQSALAGKANSIHTHTKSDITDFSDADYATAAQGAKADTALQTESDTLDSVTGRGATTSNFIDLAGGLRVSNASGGELTVNDSTGTSEATFNFSSSGAAKWQVGKNTGHDFFLYNYTRGGTDMQIDASSGNSTFYNDLIVNNDFTVDTDTFHVDSVNNRVGVGTNNPLDNIDVRGGLRVGNGSDFFRMSFSGIDLYRDGTNYIRARIAGRHVYHGVTHSTDGVVYPLRIMANTKNVQVSEGDLVVDNNITVTGTVDGRDIAQNIPALLGTAGQVLAVNSEATATEWVDASSGGSEFLTNKFTTASTWNAVSGLSGSTIAKINVSAEGATGGGVIVNVDGSPVKSVPHGLTGEILVDASSSISLESAAIYPYLPDISYTGNSKLLNGVEANPHKIRFNTDGTRMYILGYSTDTVQEYSLSTAWDITTATHIDSANISFTSQVNTPRGFDFSADGMHILACGGATIFQYNLSTAWDIDTISYSGKSLNPGGTVYGCLYSDDGTKLYAPIVTSDIPQYTLSTPYDISTATLDGTLPRFSTVASLADMQFSDDGKKFYFADYGGDRLFEFEASTAWSILDGVLKNETTLTSQDNSLWGICLGKNDEKLYSIGTQYYTGFEYDMGTVFAGSAIASVSK